MSVRVEEIEIVVKGNVEDAVTKMKKMKAKINSLLENMTKPVQQMTAKSVAITKNIDRISNDANVSTRKTTKQMDILSREISMQEKKVDSLKKKYQASFQSKSRSMIQDFRNQQKAQIQLDKMKLRYEQIGSKAIPQIGKTTQKTTKSVNMLSRTFKRMLIMLAIRAIIKQAIRGFNDLSQYSTKFNKSMSNMQASFLQLRNSISASFAPILQALEPVIVNLTNLVINLFNALAKFNTALFTNSKMYIQAKKVTTDYAKTVANTNKNLAGFDELNVISNTQNQGMPSAQEMFETQNMESDYKSRFNFDKLINSVEKLKAAAEPLKEKTFAGLEWLLNNVLIPIRDWNTQELIPAFLNLLSSNLDILNTIIEKIKPGLTWIWEKFLQPVAKWTGGIIVKVINDLANGLEKFNDMLNGKKSFKEFCSELTTGEAIMIALALAIGVVLLAVGIYNTVIAIAAGVTTVFSAALAILTSPITLIVLAIAALILIIVELVKHWDEIKIAAKNCWENIKEWWQNTADWFNEKVVIPIAKFFGNLWTGIKKGGKTIAEWVKTKVIDPIVKFFKTFANSIISVVEGLINGIVNMINGFIKGINNAISVINMIPGVSIQAIKTIPKVDLPKLAKGDVLTKETVFIGGEYPGAKSNPEIVTPQSLMYETNLKANVPVLNAIEEMTDRLTEAFSDVGVYAEFGYDKMIVGLDNAKRKRGAKLYGV